MEKPKISSNFSLEDIRKVRDFNSALHLHMTNQEMKQESNELINWFNDNYPKLYEAINKKNS